MAQPLQLEQITDISLISSSSAYTDVDTISFYVDGVYYGKYVASADAFVPDGTTPGAIGDVHIVIDNSVAGELTVGDTLSITYDGTTKTLTLESVGTDDFYLDTNLVFFYNALLTSFIGSGLIVEEAMSLTEDAGNETLLGIDESIGIGEQVFLEIGYEVDERIVVSDIVDDTENTVGSIIIADTINMSEDFDDLEFEFAIIEAPIIIGEVYDTAPENNINDKVILSESFTNPQLNIEETLSIEEAVYLNSEELYYEIRTSPFNLGNPGIKLLTEVILYGLLDTVTATYIKLYFKNYGATTFSETEWIPVNKTQASVFYIAATEFKIAVKSDAAFKPDTIKIKWKNVDNRYRRDFYVGSATPNSGR